MATVATESCRVCSKCNRRKPIEAFRFHRKDLGTRHAECTECAVKAQRERKRRKRIKDTHDFARDVNRRVSRDEPIDAIIGEMTQSCGGAGRFAESWMEAMQDAKERGKPHLVLRQHMLYLNLMLAKEKAEAEKREKHSLMSDEELAEQALIDTARMLQGNLPLIAWAAGEHGYCLVPMDEESCSEGEA